MSQSRILRRSCGDFADFSYVVHGKVLQGEKIKTLVVSSEAQCEAACVDELKCKSVNVEMSGSAKRCELNRKSRADASDDVLLSSKAGWMFKSTSYTDHLLGHLCRHLKPCNAEHLCIDTCYQPGYKCTHCKELQTAMPCQRYIHNIAFGKDTQQSSVLEPFRSHRAVDGVKTAKYGIDGAEFHCIHTGNGSYPWWRVNFQGMGVVYKVVIFRRKEAEYLYRIKKLVIRLGNFDLSWSNQIIWSHPTFTDTTYKVEKQYGQPRKGQYLFVESVIKEKMDICEVEVYGYLE